MCIPKIIPYALVTSMSRYSVLSQRYHLISITIYLPVFHAPCLKIANKLIRALQRPETVGMPKKTNKPVVKYHHAKVEPDQLGQHPGRLVRLRQLRFPILSPKTQPDTQPQNHKPNTVFRQLPSSS